MTYNHSVLHDGNTYKVGEEAPGLVSFIATSDKILKLLLFCIKKK